MAQMDDTTFEGIKTAFQVTPGNEALMMLLVRAHVEREDAAAAFALVSERDLSGISNPADLMLLARVYESAGQSAAGRDLYSRAVALNTALEDTALLARLTGRDRLAQPREGQPRLRVISNDDTRVEEVHHALQPELARVTFADVGGLDEVKDQIRRKIILPFQKPGLFKRFRKAAGGGILLYGPPGCGKTLLARATAGECGAKFYNIAIADVLDMYIGESERKLQAIFDKARESTPCVLFFDEIEALGGKRQYSREATSAKVVSQFLAEMDGFAQNNTGVLVLGATNVPWAVDSAFRRPGRFDRVQFVPPPDRVARAGILEMLLKGRPCEEGIDTGSLARETGGFSGADLRNLVETAVEEAIEESILKEKEVPVSGNHLKAALRNVKATTAEWLTTARNYSRYANEAGQYDEVVAFLARNSKA